MMHKGRFPSFVPVSLPRRSTRTSCQLSWRETQCPSLSFTSLFAGILLPDAVPVPFAASVLSVATDETLRFSCRRRAFAEGFEQPVNFDLSPRGSFRSDVHLTGEIRESSVPHVNRVEERRCWGLPKRAPNTSRETSCLQARGLRGGGAGGSHVSCWSVPCTLVRERPGCRPNRAHDDFRDHGPPAPE